VETRDKIISSIVSPLSFYALALLIVEGFLISAGRLFNLPDLARIILVGVGIALFVGVIWVVTYLVIKKPRSLVFSDLSHLAYAEMVYGTDKTASDPSVEIVQAPAISKQPERLQIPQMTGVEGQKE
jgi:hypothetical protein